MYLGVFDRVRALVIGAVLLLPGCAFADARSWAPLDPQDLKMTDFKPVPGAEAVMLYFVNEIDDPDHKEFFYSRIKILTDSGKRYATVEIPMLEKTSISDFYARTIQPDGKITELSERPYEKVVLKARGVRVRVQAFTLPQVAPGSIIEYRYELRYGNKGLRHHEWPVQHDLYAVKEHFFFRYDKRYTVRWLPARGLTTSPDNDAKAGTLQMDVANIPGFEVEELMPPERAYKMNMKFFYTSPFMSSPSAYWYEMGRWWARGIDYFIGNHKEIKAAAEEAIAGETNPEKKLQKLYDRAQQIRNLTYERHRTAKEQKQEDLKEDKAVMDVLRRGYGDRNDITMFFVGMARAAGFTSSVVMVSSRESNFFDREVLSFSQLDSEIAMVKLNGKTLLLDPGTRFCPYGLLRWMRTGTAAMDMSDPGNLVSTPGAFSESSIVSRAAEMKLTADGAARGEVRIEFSGADALERRLSALDTDEAGRKKELEDELKEWLPANSKVEMTASSGWEDHKQPLVAVFSVEVPEYASVAGKRLLASVAFFRPKHNRVPKNGPRKYPVYYHYAFTEDDHLSLLLPEGYSAETLLPPQSATTAFSAYSSSSNGVNASRVNVARNLKLNGVLFQPDRYQELREFFTKVQAADDEQLVFRQATESAGK